MLENLVNFSLIFSISCNVLLLWLLFQQKERLPILQLTSLFAVLLMIDQVLVLLLLNRVFPEFQTVLSRGHLALTFAILGGAHDLSSRFTTAKSLPAWRRREFLLGVIAAVFALLCLSGVLPEQSGSAILPVSEVIVALLTIYFITVSGFVFWEIRRRFQRARDPVTRVQIERILFGLLPLGVFMLAGFFVIPLLSFGHIFFFFTAMPIMLLLLISLVRFQLLEVEQKQELVIPVFLFSSLLVGLFFLQQHPIRSILIIASAIPFILTATAVGHLMIEYLQRLFQTAPVGHEEVFDQNVENFSDDLGKLVTQQQLWAFLAEFYKENLHTDNVAVLVAKDDITPFEISHIEGFSPESIEQLIQPGRSLVIDRLEHERQIIVRSELPLDTALNKVLGDAGVLLTIPMLAKAELIGFIFVGGFSDNALPPVSRRNLRVFRMISAQAAVALEKIRTLESMFQAQKMAGLGMFASQLAHDFRSFITLTRMQMKKNPNPRLEKHAIYMEKMVNDLLNYARPQELSQKHVDINQVIEMSLDMVDIPEHITVEKNFDRNLPKLMLDVGQLRRVFTNLFENSVRAMRVNTAGRIKITTKPLRSISRRHPNPWVHVEILDDGVGIENEYLERIFDPFFTTRKDEGGSGFGLAIVKQIINRHNGHIDATSRLGRGTVFNIRLPFQPESGNGQVTADESPINKPSEISGDG